MDYGYLATPGQDALAETQALRRRIEQMEQDVADLRRIIAETRTKAEKANHS